MQIWFDNDTVWLGPNQNFPPETAGPCELGTNWQQNPQIEVTKKFANVAQNQQITFKIRVSITGGDEGYSSIRIMYKP